MWVPPNQGIPNIGPMLESQFTDLTDYLSGDAVLEYPNLAALTPGSWRTAVVNGKIWGAPIPSTPLRPGVPRQPRDLGCGRRLRRRQRRRVPREMQGHHHQGEAVGARTVPTQRLPHVRRTVRRAQRLPGQQGPHPHLRHGYGTVGFTPFEQTTDEKRIRELLDLVNWLSDPFGTTEYMQKNFGAEGEDYVVEDGNYELTESGRTHVPGMKSALEIMTSGEGSSATRFPTTPATSTNRSRSSSSSRSAPPSRASTRTPPPRRAPRSAPASRTCATTSSRAARASTTSPRR